MNYTQINDVGKQWIRKYSLVLIIKELLEIIREKYSTVPMAWFRGFFRWCCRMRSKTEKR